MLIAAMMIDRPDGDALRDATAPAHRAFVKAHADRIVLGGPLTTGQGARNIGSLMVIAAQSTAEARSFLRQEPYSRAGLFEQVILRPFRAAIHQPDLIEGAMA